MVFIFIIISSYIPYEVAPIPSFWWRLRNPITSYYWILFWSSCLPPHFPCNHFSLKQLLHFIDFMDLVGHTRRQPARAAPFKAFELLV